MTSDFEKEFPSLKGKDIRKVICDIISKMLDNPDEYEIYPTTECYNAFEKYIKELIQQNCLDKQRVLDAIENCTIIEKYPSGPIIESIEPKKLKKELEI